MKRFYREASVGQSGDGWQVMLDGRVVKTQGGRAQTVPTRAMAKVLAGEWVAQGEEIDPSGFVNRDLADFAIDVADTDRAGLIATLLGFAETDTLCYRAEPDDALFAAQHTIWEPLLTAAEARWDVHFERISGIIHRPQPAATSARLRTVLAAHNAFALSALNTLASLAASLVIALTALEPDADTAVLWRAANLEEDWQADLWGRDAEAEDRRARRYAAFSAALDFARLAHG